MRFWRVIWLGSWAVIPRLLIIVAIAGLIFLGGIRWGEHGMRQCAIDFPHDGQCGLVGMEGDAFGALGGSIALLCGVIWIVLWARRRKK